MLEEQQGAVVPTVEPGQELVEAEHAGGEGDAENRPPRPGQARRNGKRLDRVEGRVTDSHVIRGTVRLHRGRERPERHQADPEAAVGTLVLRLGGKPRGGQCVDVGQADGPAIMRHEQCVVLEQEAHDRRPRIVGVLDDLRQALEPIAGEHLGAAPRCTQSRHNRTRQTAEQLPQTHDRCSSLGFVPWLVDLRGVARLRVEEHLGGLDGGFDGVVVVQEVHQVSSA